MLRKPCIFSIFTNVLLLRGRPMKKFAMMGLGLAGLMLLTSAAQGFGGRKASCAPACDAPAVQVQYVDKVVTCYEPKMVEKEIQCVVNKLVPRVVEQTHKCTVMVPEYKDEIRTVVCNKMVPKTVEKEVTVCRMVRETCTDSCGRCYTVCKPVTEVRKVTCTVYECQQDKKDVTVRVCTYKPEEKTWTTKCTVYECQQDKKDVTVRVCSYKPEEKTWTTKCTVYECVQENVTRKVMTCEMVAVQKTVKVAVCVPVACK
jgi:hypothetical protein